MRVIMYLAAVVGQKDTYGMAVVDALGAFCDGYVARLMCGLYCAIGCEGNCRR